jgi:hypothetical protein
MGLAPQTSSPGGMTDVLRRMRDIAIVNGEFARGVKDPNKLTDAVFYSRHPEWKGKSLKNASVTLRTEWMQIRDNVVAPALKVAQTKPPAPAPVKPAAPVPAAPSSTKPFDYTFPSIQRWKPDQWIAALRAGARYKKVAYFFPLYVQINSALSDSDVHLAAEGFGKIEFTIGVKTLRGLASDETQAKALETALHGMAGQFFEGSHSQIPMGEKLITALGLGLMFIEIAEGIHNEKMLSTNTDEAKEWRTRQKIRFITAIMAPTIRKKWGYGNDRDTAVTLNNTYWEFQPIFFEFQKYRYMEEDLRDWNGNPPPGGRPTTMGPA